MPSERPYEVAELSTLTPGVKVWNKDTGEWVWTSCQLSEISISPSKLAADLADLLNQAHAAGREAKAKEIREQIGL